MKGSGSQPKTSDQTLMELSPSPRSSILYIPSWTSAPLNVDSDACESVICVVVVDLKTIGPFDRTFPLDVFDGIEYDIDWGGRVSSELTPRPMRTMISENCTEEKKKERRKS
jgi:hypothetical protein